jgi:hypothetical protein
MRARIVVPAVAACAVAAAVFVGLTGLEKDSPQKAIYGLAHALEHDNVADACGRLFPAGLIPPDVARGLFRTTEAQKAGPEDLAAWRPACARLVQNGEALVMYRTDRLLVSDVRTRAVPTGGLLTGAATALVRTKHTSPRTVWVVRSNATWRVVTPQP